MGCFAISDQSKTVSDQSETVSDQSETVSDQNCRHIHVIINNSIMKT